MIHTRHPADVDPGTERSETQRRKDRGSHRKHIPIAAPAVSPVLAFHALFLNRHQTVRRNSSNSSGRQSGALLACFRASSSWLSSGINEIKGRKLGQGHPLRIQDSAAAGLSRCAGFRAVRAALGCSCLLRSVLKELRLFIQPATCSCTVGVRRPTNFSRNSRAGRAFALRPVARIASMAKRLSCGRTVISRSGST